MTVNLFFRFKIIYVVFGVVLSACSRQSEGFAPNTSPTPPPVVVNDENNFKYGETVTTTNNWEASLDTTDPTEEIVLANGWTVEVKHE